MALGGLGLFLLEAAAGTAFLLLFFPVGTLGKGFFSLHGALALAFVLLATVVSPAGMPRPAGWASSALLALYVLLAHADRAGGTGEHRFVLHADGPGETTLVARHARPWAPDSEVRRFRLTVRVR